MKRCPQCEAEYDDHVEYCFVDGAELVLMDASDAGPLPPPPGSPTRRMLPIMLALAGVAMLAMIAVVVVLAMSWAGDGTVEEDPIAPPTQPLAAQPAGGERQPGAKVAGTPALAARVEVRSVPSGAEVWEGNSRLCPATPCTVEHPDHAPIPRRFEVRLDGYRPSVVQLTDVKQPVEARLSRDRNSGPRPRPVAPVPDPPSPPRDAGSIMDER